MSFFQKNGPLLQTAEEAGGGGGNVVSRTGNRAAKTVAPKTIDVSQGLPDTTVDGPLHISELSSSVKKIGRDIGLPPSAKPPKAEKAPPGDIQVTMETGPVTTDAEQVMLAEIAERERAYEYGIGAAQMQAYKAAESAQLQFAEIAKEDAAAARMLAREVFPRVRKVNEELTRDIEAASAMRINPHNYFQSIGRAGRAASVLAVGISQLAAGAGNPNSVWARIDAAINRDIAAQKDNLANVWASIDAKRTLNQDDLDLLEKRVAFDDHARAVAFAGLAAQVSAAKQRFMSESVHLNMQMIEERALQASIIAAAEARAKYTSFKMDARVNSVWGAMKKAQVAKQLATLRQNLVAAENDVPAAQQAMQGLGGPLTNLEGEPVGPQAPGAPAAETPAAPGAAPTSPASRVASRRRPTPKGDVSTEAPSSPVEATTDFQGPSGTPAPVDAQEAPAGAQEEPEEPTPTTPEEITPKQVGRLTLQEAATLQPRTVARMRPEAIEALPRGTVAALAGMDEDAVRAGSYENAARVSRGQPIDPSQDLEVLAAEANSGVNIAVAKTLPDGQALSNVYAPPNPQDRVFYTTDENGKEVFNARLFEKAVERWEHHKRWPESFVQERPNVNILDGTHAPGWNNVIDVGGGLVAHIKSDRTDLMADPGKRAEIAKDIRSTYTAAARVAAAAKDYDRLGTKKGVFGFRVTEDGLTWVPADPELRFAYMRMKRAFMKGGVQAIKALDPAGRLSNEDIKFGMALDAAVQDGETLGVDQMIQLYERYFGEGTGSIDAIRASANKMFALTAKEYLTDLDGRVNDAVVLSPEAVRMQLQQAQEVYEFIGQGQVEVKRAEPEGGAKPSKAKQVLDVLTPEGIASHIPGVRQVYQARELADIFFGADGEE